MRPAWKSPCGWALAAWGSGFWAFNPDLAGAADFSDDQVKYDWPWLSTDDYRPKVRILHSNHGTNGESVRRGSVRAENARYRADSQPAHVACVLGRQDRDCSGRLAAKVTGRPFAEKSASYWDPGQGGSFVFGLPGLLRIT